MFHVKDDFRAGAPVTQVGAAWFNKVGAFINNLVGGRGVRIVKNESGPSYIELEEDAGTGEGDSPTAVGSYPTDEVTQEAGTLWRAGGENGAEVMVAYKCVFDTDGQHKTYAAKLVLSADGRVLRIEKAENAGWMV